MMIYKTKTPQKPADEAVLYSNSFDALNYMQQFFIKFYFAAVLENCGVSP